MTVENMSTATPSFKIRLPAAAAHTLEGGSPRLSVPSTTISGLALAPFTYPTTPSQLRHDTPLSTPTTNSITQSASHSQDFLQRLDPALHPTPSTPSTRPSEPHDGDNIADPSDAETTPSKKKRQVPSSANALHGFVEGVGRGSSVFRM